MQVPVATETVCKKNILIHYTKQKFSLPLPETDCAIHSKESQFPFIHKIHVHYYGKIRKCQEAPGGLCSPHQNHNKHRQFIRLVSDLQKTEVTGI